MSEEQPVTALSTEEEARLRNAIETARTPGRRLRVQLQDDVSWLTWRSLGRLLATLDREREAVADLRASLAAEVRALPEVMWGGLVTVAVSRADVLRLIEGDTDVRER